MKLGSLFDGSGGFPLSGALCGIEPVWAAEVEPYPIAVTRSRFPQLVHLGDISKVSGANIKPVDIITFGSPCQDLSVAGKRAGLKHEANGDEETTRSGLFMEAVRIIKEMREATNGEYPRFALWENVPGAFSSNKGDDFRVVCEELIKIVEPRASMPAVPKNGWAYADSYIGDGWSLAYRVFDAQHWGVPQRRRRIHLIVDFRGECAREILFEREGLRGYFAEGRTPWQILASYAQDGAGADDRAGEGAGGILQPSAPGYSDGLLGGSGGRQLDAVGFLRQLGGVEAQNEVSPTLMAAAGMSGNNKPCVAYTLKVRSECDAELKGKSAGNTALVQTDKAATLATVQDQYLFQPVAYSFDSLASNSMKSKNPHSGCRTVEVAKTLDTTDPNPCKNQGGIAIVAPICMATQQGGAEIRTDDKAPTLTAAAGMSGNNQPVVAILDNIGGQAEYGKISPVNGTLRAGAQGAIAYAALAATIGLNGEEKVSPTLIARMETATGTTQDNLVVRAPTPQLASGKDVTGCLMASGYEKLGAQEMFSGDYTVIEGQPIPIHDQATRFAGKRGDKSDGKGNGLGVGDAGDPMNTLTGGDRHAVAYGTDVGFFSSLENQSPTLLARGYKDPHLVSYPGDGIHYIVRRLTPTECARLQGFADWWSIIEPKDSLTDEEYRFWMEVRNTHAAINGKKVQDYDPKQILAWYNRLWTDAAEYKMWGNGIALPPALYCMQGIVEVMNKADDDSWLM